jgi:serine/threonine protein kinase
MKMNAPLPVPPETVLGGRYRVGRLLGRGGFGAVYQATQLDLGRQVAIKVLFEQGLDADTLARFEREAKATGSLGHPHIVQVTDFQPQHPPFLVMELVPGESLDALLQRNGRLPPQRAVRIAMQVLSALGAAHRIGIVHRDIKPANLMLMATATGEDFVKVLDFGIAKDLAATGSAATQSGAVMGTVGYMAPEQALGLLVDVRSDIYAVGGVLYRMLVGTSPHQAANIGELMRMMAAGVVVPIEQRDPSLPPALTAIVGRALAHDPEARFPSAEAFSATLAASLGLAPPASLPSWAPPGPGAPAPPTSRPENMHSATVADGGNKWAAKTSIDAGASTRTSVDPPRGSFAPPGGPTQGPNPSNWQSQPMPAPSLPPVPSQAHPAPARTAGSTVATKVGLAFGGLTFAALLVTGGVLFALKYGALSKGAGGATPDAATSAPRSSEPPASSATKGPTEITLAAGAQSAASPAASVTASTPSGNRSNVPPRASASAAPTAPSKGPAGVPDVNGTCQCNAPSAEVICAKKIETVKCACVKAGTTSPLCSAYTSLPGAKPKTCQLMQATNVPAGSPCQGQSAPGMVEGGEWRCDFCGNDNNRHFAGTEGAACSGVGLRSGKQMSGVLACQ